LFNKCHFELHFFVISSEARNLFLNERRNLPFMTSTNSYFVYLLTNWNNKVMYVGITNDLERRLFEHKNKLISGFSEKYNLTNTTTPVS